MEAEYIKNSVGPILTEALQSLILHVPYPGAKPSAFATTIDPIDYIGQYLLRHAQKEEEKEALEKLRAADRSIIDNFAVEQARLKKHGDDLTIQSEGANEDASSLAGTEEQIAELTEFAEAPEAS